MSLHISAYDDTMPVNRYDWDQYWDVLAHACGVHMDREQIRHGLWKEYPASDQMSQIKIKIERVMHTVEHGEADPERGTTTPEADNMKEELLDIINYAVFAYRIIDGRI